MGIRLQKAIFHNRAPFEHLELNFGDENVAILSGIEGGNTIYNVINNNNISYC